MKIGEIRERSDEELRTLIRQLHEDKYKLRVKKSTNQLEDTNALRRLRVDIARAETVLQGRKLKIEQRKGSSD